MVIHSDYLTAEEAATALGCSTVYIYKLARAGKLQGIKTGGRLYLYRVSVETCNLKDKRERGRPRVWCDLELAIRCKQARMDAGMKQNEAARLLHCHKSMLSLQERGLRSIQQADLSLMAKVYGVSAKYLATGEHS